MAALLDVHATATDAGPAAEPQHLQTAFDLAFLGEPADRPGRDAWHREIALAERAGWRVLAGPPPAGAAELDAAIVLLAEPRALAGLRLVAADTQLVLRHMGERAARAQPELERRLRHRVMIAPCHGLERRAILARLPARTLTAEDWPSFLCAERLLAARSRRPAPPFTIGIAEPGTGNRAIERLRSGLAARGLGDRSVRLVAVAADAAGDDALARLHVLVGPARALDPAVPRLVVRALEAGVVSILSDAWKPLLRDAAVFQDWAQLPDRLAALATDPALWRRCLAAQADRAQHRYGEEAWLDRVRGGIFGPACPPRLAAASRRRMEPHAAAAEADLVIIGDFRRREEAIEQLLPQIARHAAAGRRVALLQAWNGRPGPLVHPGIDACLRQGRATAVGPAAVVRARAVQVVVPRLTVPALEALRPAISADYWHLVEVDAAIRDYDPAVLHTTIERLYAVTPTWHAVHPDVQATLAARVPTHVDPWPVQATPELVHRRRSGERHVVGVQAYDPADAAAAIDLLRAAAGAPNVDLRALLVGTRRTLDVAGLPPVQVLSLDGTDIARFVAGLDLLVVPPLDDLDRLPRRAVAEALAIGVPVLAPAKLEPELPAGPIFLAPEHWAAFVVAAACRRRGAARTTPVAEGADPATRLGLGTRPLVPAVVGAKTRRVLFVTANGVGLGHITRLSAIARRLPDRLEPVFATMSQAAAVLEQMGFPTELLTTYNGKAAKPWDCWTRERMRDILDYHQPRALVLDASNPYAGVVEAAACRPGLGLVWVRRGMWRASQDNSEFLTRAPYFDLVIEPDDIAAALDVARPGPAAGEVLRVPPIGLLDEHELLPRAEARAALGLPEQAEAGSVLVQLGSGTTRDLNRLLSRVVEVLQCFPGLEIVLAQWLNTADEYRGRWPGVRLLTGFPIPRYYRAFDFTISAAGYNSFNDLLRFGVPTIFIANDAECMDDQGARARHAEAEGAAFDIDESNLEALYDCVQAILQPAVRDYLGERARTLAKPNGAALAARAIARLSA